MNKREAEKLKVKGRRDPDLKQWVCEHCGTGVSTFYVVTGHDHTDDYIWWCECRRQPEKLTHQPKGSMCIWCANAHTDCSDLPFSGMPIIGEHEGVKIVACTHRKPINV